jgi:hypothetical protein
MFNNVTDPGEYRVNFDVGATTALMKWLTWNIAVSDRYPEQGIERRHGTC